MKANAPEKLYIFNHEKREVWFSKTSDKQVEYTRTDAFIEKATEYLQEHLIDHWSQGVTDESKFVDGFKKYMKGEEV